MQRWLGCRSRLVSAALSTLPVSRFAQDQAGSAARRRFWRRRPTGPPLWRIARTRLYSTWHPHSAPTVPTLGCQLREYRSVQNSHMDRPIGSMHKKFGQPKIQIRTTPPELTASASAWRPGGRHCSSSRAVPRFLLGSFPAPVLQFALVKALRSVGNG
jgi:hypothetical protein